MKWTNWQTENTSYCKTDEKWMVCLGMHTCRAHSGMHVGRKTGSAWAKGEVAQGGTNKWKGVTRQHREENKRETR